MKLKLDENVHRRVARELLALGHDAATVHEQGLSGRPDAEIAAVVKTEGRCLVTFDIDFADTRRFPPHEFPGLVILRLRHRTAGRQLERITHLVTNNTELSGRLWIVEDDRVRDWTP